MRAKNEQGLYYPVLLFVVISALSVARPVSALLEGTGRNSIWFLFPPLLIVLIGTWFSMRISQRYGDASFMLACGEIGFRWLSPCLYVIYGAFFLGISVYNIMTAGDFFSRVLLHTDPQFTMISGALITALAALFPIETHIRYAQILLLFAMPIFFLTTLTPLMEMEWSWAWPVFHIQEITHPFSAGAGVMFIFSPLAAATFVKRKSPKSSFLPLALLTVGAAVYASYIILISIASFGIHTAKQMEYLSYYTIDAVRIENFVFERIIFLSILIWKYFEMAGSAFLMRCAALCLAQAIGLRLNFFAVLLSGGAAALFIWLVDAFRFFQAAPVWLGICSFSLIFVIPLMAYIAMLLRGTKVRR